MKKTIVLALLSLSALFLISSVSAYSYYDDKFSETWKYTEDISGKERGFVLTHTINTPDPYTPLNYGYDTGYGALHRYNPSINRIALPTTFTSPAVGDAFGTFRKDTERRDFAKWSGLRYPPRYSSYSTPYYRTSPTYSGSYGSSFYRYSPSYSAW